MPSTAQAATQAGNYPHNIREEGKRGRVYYIFYILIYVAASLNRLGRGQLADIHPFYYKYLSFYYIVIILSTNCYIYLFISRHLGSFAYIGGESAVLDTQSFKGGGFGIPIISSCLFTNNS